MSPYYPCCKEYHKPANSLIDSIISGSPNEKERQYLNTRVIECVYGLEGVCQTLYQQRPIVGQLAGI